MQPKFTNQSTKKKTNIKFHLNPTEKKEKIQKKLLRDLPQSLLIKRVSSIDIERKKQIIQNAKNEYVWVSPRLTNNQCGITTKRS